MNPRGRVSLFAALATMLGSLSLLPVYDSYGWLPRVVLIIAVVTAASLLLQRIRLLAAGAPLAMALTWIATLTVLYAHSVAPLGFVPGPAALRLLHATLSSGFSDTTQLAAPVPVTRGISLMTTGGIGLVAFVVETLAGTLRRPAVAGLPLLAIFTVPAAIISHGVGWQPFVFAAVGYLALLLAEGRERVSRWGRPVRASRPSAASLDESARRPDARDRTASVGGGATRHLSQISRRVGIAAITVAVLVPVVVPGLHSGWFGTYRTAGTAGLAPNAKGVSINPLVTLRQDLDEPVPQSLFTYTTTGTPTYLRLLTLDTFDGTQWALSSLITPEDVHVDKGIPAPTGTTLAPSGDVDTDVAVTGLREPYLPTPATPTTVKAHGDWRYNPVNPVVYSQHSTTIHLSYSVSSAVYAPTAAYLNSQPAVAATPSLQTDLTTPSSLPPQIAQTADSIIAQAGAVTPYQKALALQAWLRAGTYDTTIKTGTDENALLTFIGNRRGYCEQFAATMALMARLEGIPARVDVGFTPGTPVGTGYEVTTADAHAWPELYFRGAGWLRFEPTPRGDGQTSSPSYANTALAPQLPASASASASASATAPAPAPIHGPSAPAPAAAKAHHRGAAIRVPVLWGGFLVLLLLAVASAPLTRLLIRRRRWTAADTEAARAHAAWDELGDDLRDLRLQWSGNHDSPRRAAATLLATRALSYEPSAREALGRLARAEELARYAPRALPLENDPRADEAMIRHALFGSVSGGRRLRARLAPSSARSFASLLASWGADRGRATSEWVRRRTTR